MSTKKLVIGIVITIILFIFFIKYAFNAIQKVELTLDTQSIKNSEQYFEEELAFLKQYGSYEFVEGFALDKLQIVLIDNKNKQAILWNDLNSKGNKQLDYKEIPNDIKYSNSFFIKLNKKNSVIMNCDTLLGDIRERIVVSSYQYMRLEESKLNPDEVQYFQTIDENVYVRFLRNMMIESLAKAFQSNGSLEEFKNYIYKWQNEVGDTYKSIAKYDMYEGSIEYIKIKVQQVLDADFQLSAYLHSKKEAYGFYTKEDEYRLIGMLMLLYTENNNRNLYPSSNSNNDVYMNLLHGTPYVSREMDSGELELFETTYAQYNNKLKEMINTYSLDNLDVSMTYREIECENYEETIKIRDNYYIYTNYIGRLKNGEVILKDYILVKVAPYKIEYYYN